MKSGRNPERLPPGEDIDPVTEEALTWLVQLHSGKASDDDWVRYEAWKKISPIQHAAAARAEMLWNRLGKVLKPPRRRVVKGTIIGLGLCGILKKINRNSSIKMLSRCGRRFSEIWRNANH